MTCLSCSPDQLEMMPGTVLISISVDVHYSTTPIMTRVMASAQTKTDRRGCLTFQQPLNGNDVSDISFERHNQTALLPLAAEITVFALLDWRLAVYKYI